jgi:hypothetical protein
MLGKCSVLCHVPAAVAAWPHYLTPKEQSASILEGATVRPLGPSCSED